MEALIILLEAGGDATDACTIAAVRSYFDTTKLCLEHGADPEPALKRDADNAASRNICYQPMDGILKSLLQQYK